MMKLIKKLSARQLCFVAVTFLFGGTLLFPVYQVSAVSVDEAKSIAIKDAGVDEKTADVFRAEKDINDGQEVYDIEFYTHDTDYEYVIDAKTGRILDRDENRELRIRSNRQETTSSVTTSQDNKSTTSPTTTETKSTQSPRKTESITQGQRNISRSTPEGYISEDDAKKRALDDAKLDETSVSHLYIFLDTDDGITYYEVEFYDLGTYIDYDYKINARTGQIVESSQDTMWD